MNKAGLSAALAEIRDAVGPKGWTDAADDMIQLLSKEYNKARQWGITADLLDIVGGSEAMAG